MTEGSLCLNDSGKKNETETILWYKEILRLDPASRIFLPYARLLTSSGCHAEAIDILKAGLSHHAEHLEARLLLIDLLHASQQRDEAKKEAEKIIALLSQSCALWEIWSQQPNLQADQSAMLLFLGASFCQKNHSLAEIIAAGMAALRCHTEQMKAPLKEPDGNPCCSEQEISSPSLSTSNAPSSACFSESTPQAPACFTMEEGIPWYGLDSVPDEDDMDNEEPTPEQSPARSPSAMERFFPEPDQPLLCENGEQTTVRTSPRGNLEGKSSLRTRSMALILEEQGATGEAAAIYRELLEGSSSPEERAELNAKLNRLILGAENTSSATSANSGILTMLEALATRLENKSHA